MNAFLYIKSLQYLPDSTEGQKTGRPSNSEIRRWLIKKSVLVNGITPSPDDEITFPVIELIFFPTSNRKTTMIKENKGGKVNVLG